MEIVDLLERLPTVIEVVISAFCTSFGACSVEHLSTAKAKGGISLKDV